MRRAAWCSLLLAAGANAPAFERAWLIGLDVRTSGPPQILTTQGRQSSVHHARGQGVPQLAARIADSWGHAGAVVRTDTAGTWQVASRLAGDRLDVVQWRGTGADAELLLSSQPLRASITSPRLPQPPLPATCRWSLRTGGPVAQRQFLQATARCPAAGTAQPSASLRATLRAAGWEFGPGTATSWSLARGDLAAWLTFVGGQAGADHALVWLVVGPGDGDHP